MTSAHSRSEIACVILAAGLGRRFGGSKMLHIMPNGQSMIEQTIKQYQSAFRQIYIVVAEQDERIKKSIKDYSAKVEKLESESRDQKQNICLNSFQLVECADSDEGMSTSLIAGVNATIDAQGWLIGLGDMPYVACDTIVSLKNNLKESNIVMPRYRQQLGNPVGFGRQFKDELLALRGDTGGKSITQQFTKYLKILDTQDQGVVSDLDTPGEIR